jgi:hypothetical protein
MEDIRQKTTATDLAMRAQQTGGVMRVVGWTLVAFDCLIAVWIWVGLRSGSDFWLYWVVIEGVLGLALIWMGTRRRAEAARALGEAARRQL